MTSHRRLALAALATLPLALAACDNKCPTTNPKIAAGGVPTCSGIQPGVTVQVKLGVCPRCDEAFDACNVTLPAAGDKIIQLDPIVQVCQADNSCPNPPTSCNAVTCTFTAPATPDTYQLLVYDPAQGPLQAPFQVTAGGSTVGCGG